MKKLLPICCLLLLLTGCVRQQPTLAPDATPRPTPTPAPPDVAQSVEREPWKKDALGAFIYDGAAHYARYLTFTDVRVFEYEGGTMMEGVCDNAYPEPLAGRYEIVFTGKGDTVLARADVHTRGEDGVFPPGKGKIYAAIDTDTTLLSAPFTLAAVEGPLPQSASPSSLETPPS